MLLCYLALPLFCALICVMLIHFCLSYVVMQAFHLASYVAQFTFLVTCTCSHDSFNWQWSYVVMLPCLALIFCIQLCCVDTFLLVICSYVTVPCPYFVHSFVLC